MVPEDPPFEEWYEPDVLARIDAALHDHDLAADAVEIGESDREQSKPAMEAEASADADGSAGADPCAEVGSDEGELIQVDFEDDAPARGPASIDGRIAQWARGSIAGAFLAGTGRAIEDLLRVDPEIAEIVEDPGYGNEDTRPVRLVLVPGAPKQSKAFVRPWLFHRSGAEAEGEGDVEGP